MNIDLTLTELSLLVLAALASASYAKSEGATSFLAAVVGVLVAIVIVVLTR